MQGKERMFNKLRKRLRHLQFSRKQQQAFLEDLSMLMDDGVPMSQAVDTIRQVSEGSTKQVAAQIARSIAQGKQLAEGMRGWFSRPLIEVIRSGETSGTLAKTIKSAAQSFSQQTNALSTFVSTLVYPTLIVVLAFIMLVFVKQSVLDSFSSIKPIVTWPDIGQTLYRLGYLTQHWWWLVTLIIVGSIYAITRLLEQLTGDLRDLVDEIPLVSLYREITAARFMETLGLLISNGIVLKKALSIMHREAAPYLSWHILKMEFRLSGGQENIADVLDTKLIKREDIVRLRVVANSKGFDHALISLGRQANRRASRAITISGKISGGLLLVFGAFMAASIVFGIYSVGSSIAS